MTDFIEPVLQGSRPGAEAGQKVEQSRAFKSSRPEVFCKKGVLKNFVKFTEKHLCWSLFFNKVTGLRTESLFKKGLCCEFCEIYQLFTEHLQWQLLLIVYHLFSSIEQSFFNKTLLRFSTRSLLFFPVSP